MRNIVETLNGMRAPILMMMVQILSTVMNIFYKIAISDGISIRVLTAYRLMFAAATTIPLAVLFERKNRPKLTWRVVFMSFFSGLFGGSLFQNLFYESLALISATFSAAVFNLIPAVTFILAVCFGYEKLNLHKASGKAKVFGTIIGVGGVMILTFLKGFEIIIWKIHINLLHKNGTLTGGDSGSKVIGIFCGIGSCFCYALWFIIQAKMSREYHGHYSSTALMSLMGAMQATIFALCVEKDWSQWRLGWSIRLLTAAYSGIVPSGLMVIVIAWCVGMRGPLYASVFNPVTLVLMAIAGSIVLNEKLYLGSLIGAVLIVVGLYMILWGKSKEMITVVEEIEEIEVAVTSAKSEDEEGKEELALAYLPPDNHGGPL